MKMSKCRYYGNVVGYNLGLYHDLSNLKSQNFGEGARV
jgi:hypothetical protein